MARFYSLFSSSKGNCSYIENENGGVLIDASPSFKSISDALKNRSIDARCIKGIVITHEHSDHVSALKVLLKNINAPLYLSDKVLSYLVEKDLIPAKTEYNIIEANEEFSINGINITPFRTPHDSMDSFGFVIKTNSTNFGYATDLGTVTPEILSRLSDCKTVFIESNYDENMLICGKYNRLLKMRIMGERGHLSNYDCAEASVKLLASKTSNFILAHLSEENNTPTLAENEVLSAMNRINAKVGRDYILEVSSRNGLQNPIIF